MTNWARSATRETKTAAVLSTPTLVAKTTTRSWRTTLQLREPQVRLPSEPGTTNASSRSVGGGTMNSWAPLSWFDRICVSSHAELDNLATLDTIHDNPTFSYCNPGVSRLSGTHPNRPARNDLCKFSNHSPTHISPNPTTSWTRKESPSSRRDSTEAPGDQCYVDTLKFKVRFRAGSAPRSSRSRRFCSEPKMHPHDTTISTSPPNCPRQLEVSVVSDRSQS